MTRGLPVIALLLAGPALATTYVNDPLTAASAPGRGFQGGTFGPSGWTTTGKTDSIWYEIADALPTARVEYSVTGLSVQGSLAGSDHDILAVYQAPVGYPEPVAYSPYFRNNDLKVFTRLFGRLEPGRGGALKVEFAFCPRGPPWFDNSGSPCPTNCNSGTLAYANGRPEDIGWDASKTYRMALYWSPGRMAFSRDGTELGSVTYPGVYAGQPLRIRLGSPRHGNGTYEFMPLGLTFKDLLITGTPGGRTLACGAPQPGPDAGSSTPGPDASTADVGFTPGETQVLTAVQDATASTFAAGVSPDVTDLAVESDSGGRPSEIPYLRFPKPAGPVRKAILRLRTASFRSAAGRSGAVHAVADQSWTESTLTFANRPPYDPVAYGPARSVVPDRDVDWDVTALVAAGVTNFAIVSTEPDGSHYLSKEASGGSAAPKLLVEVAASADGGSSVSPVPDAAGVEPGADGGALASDAALWTSPSRDGSVADVAEAPADARPPSPRREPPPGEIAGGCSCGSASGFGGPALLSVTLLLVSRIRRRR